MIWRERALALWLGSVLRMRSKVIAVGMGDACFGGCLEHGGEGMALQGVIA